MDGDGWWIQVGKRIATTDVGPRETWPEESYQLISSDPLGELDLESIRERSNWYTIPSPYWNEVTEENAVERYMWWLGHVKRTAMDCLFWIDLSDGHEIDYAWWPLLRTYDWRPTEEEALARAAEMRAEIDKKLAISNVRCPNCYTPWSEYLAKAVVSAHGLTPATIGMPAGVSS